MGVVHSPDSGYAIERRKHEAHHTPFGAPGRPYVFYDYPVMMYRGKRNSPGITFESQLAADEHERRNLESRGFVVGGMAAAMAELDREHTEHGQLAAEINYGAKRMSEGAQREVAAFQDSHSATHQPVIPETPLPPKRTKIDTK